MSSENTLLTRAKDVLKQKNYTEAEHLLLSILKVNKENYQALYTLGNLYHTRGKFDRAIIAYKKALTVKPNFTEAALSLSILYNDLGRYDEGRLIFNRVKQQVPQKDKLEDVYLDEKLAAKHVELAELYETYHRFGEAEVEFQKALKLKPQDPQIIIKIAQLHEKQGASNQAIQELKQLVHQRPDYIPGRIKLGLTYYAKGQMIEALREWEHILDFDPQHPEALMYLEMAQRATTTTL